MIPNIRRWVNQSRLGTMFFPHVPSIVKTQMFPAILMEKEESS
jgi:hypothetical protein